MLAEKFRITNCRLPPFGVYLPEALGFRDDDKDDKDEEALKCNEKRGDIRQEGELRFFNHQEPKDPRQPHHNRQRGASLQPVPL